MLVMHLTSYLVFTRSAMHKITVCLFLFLPALSVCHRNAHQLLEIPSSASGILDLLRGHNAHPGLTAALESLQNNRSATNAYILVFGLSGAGKSSTINRIVQGQLTTQPSVKSIQEYILPIPLPSLGISNGQLHIVDTPGIGESDGVQEDARVLASLKQFRRAHPDLANKYPTAVLILSNFNDNRASGESSKFVTMLKAYGLIQDNFVSTPSNVNFLLTRFMSETRLVTRRPQDRIRSFVEIIQQFTKFPSPIVVKVGENDGEGKDLALVNGSFQLPNGELYPENIIKSMVDSARGSNDPIGAAILETLMPTVVKPDLNAVRVVPHELIQSTDPEIASIANTLSGQTLNIDDNEVSRALLSGYEQIPQDLKIPGILPVLQTAFQNLEITKLEDIPRVSNEIAKLLQSIDLSPTAVAILDKGLGLRVPVLYTNNFIVGNGYDVLRDMSMPSSPFEMINVNLEPSPLGYKIPSVLHCEILPEDKMDTFAFPSSYIEYVGSRIRDFEMQEEVQKNLFEGQTREGFNLNDGITPLTSFTAVRDIQKFRLDLKANVQYTQDFIDAINSLIPFNSGDKESVKIWTSFFNNYGTHVVTSAFGGGSMVARVSSDDTLKTLVSSPQGVNELKEYLLNFSNPRQAPSTQPQYSYQGGEARQEMSEIRTKTVTERTTLLDDWKASLLTKPVILQTKLSLKPISVYVRELKPEVADEVDRAIQLLFSGNLVYTRVKPPSRPAPRPAPTIPSSPSQRLPSLPIEEAIQVRNGMDSQSYQCERCRPQVKECPISSCPTQPPIEQVEVPVACPSSSASGQDKQAAQKHKFKLNPSMNLVGQSYNILSDTVMKASPFQLTKGIIGKLRGNIEGIPDFIVEAISDTDSACFSSTYRRFEDKKRYLLTRLQTLDLRTWSVFSRLQSSNVSSNYIGEVKPGYNIVENNNPYARITRAEERRTFKITMSYGPAVFTENFKSQVNALPNFRGSIDREDCRVRKAWMDIFETFGTHVVTGAFVGRSVVTTVTGNVHSINVDSFPLNAGMGCDRVDGITPVWLHSDISLKIISDYIQIINRDVTFAATEAIFALLEGRLRTC